MDERLRARMAEMEESFESTGRELADPAVLADLARYEEASRRYAELRPLVASFREIKAGWEEAGEALELAEAEADPELAAGFRDMAAARREEAARLSDQLRAALLSADPDDGKDVIVEIRAAAGGAEAALWARDLLRMYERYAERRGFGVEPMGSSASEAGGLSRVAFAVKGKGAFSRFKYEAGVHRVQRVPQTESQGRVHTSTATVAVMAEAEEVEVALDPADVKVDTFRSSGPGGQSVNTTDSAVRLTFLPTGLTVTCQDEKSQLQNKEKAFRVLRARLYQAMLEEQRASEASGRRSQIGSGDRSEKIRTYNFKENRVTDHRIGLTVKRLPQILEGNLDQMVDAAAAEESARRLEEGG